jgi:hypothetical protein
MKKTQPVEVIAPLEGMKIMVTSGTCTLHEYDFVANVWGDVDSMPWPLTRTQAEIWLEGWNRVDHFTALNQLIAPLPE